LNIINKNGEYMGSHKNLIMGEDSNLGKDITFGYNNIILDHVTIGDGCLIGNNVVIHEGSVIGNNVRIDDNTVIGKLPMKALNSATTKDRVLQPAKIGNNCIIGTGTIIYRGAEIGAKVLVADLATVRENVKIGEGTIIGRGAAIENYCTIGSYCKLETNVYITAYSTVEDKCFIAPCVATSNDNYVGRTKERFQHFKGVTVKKGGRIGANATILPGKTIGEDALIAAGSVVTKDIPGKKIYCGIPAKELKDVPNNQLLENQ
jgi:UDP-2-acetamido-3-amino-2,3-dideoxy-glucuronate N-acetyltransferase